MDAKTYLLSRICAQKPEPLVSPDTSWYWLPAGIIYTVKYSHNTKEQQQTARDHRRPRVCEINNAENQSLFFFQCISIYIIRVL